VLVVEDDPDTYDSLALALDSAGYVVEHARDGNEALAVLDRFQPDLIITDLVMPGMSGEALIQAVRARGGRQPRVLVVSGLAGLSSRCASLGADECLDKPFDLDTLLDTVAQSLGRTEGGPDPRG
jgi:DNA-binding response OmpR family regulator